MISTDDVERFATESEVWLLTNCDGKMCGTGRHYSGGNYICIHNNLAAKRPNLVLEWDYEKNEGNPKDFKLKSNKYKWWICRNEKNWCGCHKWETKICHRGDGRGCPYCCGRMTCPHYSLLSEYPQLEIEWDYERNKISMSEVSPNSGKNYWWICRSQKNWCGCHKWYISPSQRNARTQGCPYCANLVICPHSSLLYLNPEIASEWDYERNQLDQDQVVPGSAEYRWWRCKFDNDHRWRTKVYHRTQDLSGCRHCACLGYSTKQIDWIKSIELQSNIVIRTAIDPDGEYKIDGIGKVDGYREETNTVYEFHGDYWHGNPNLYHPNDVNERVKKPFGELYQKTVERDNKILALGYNLVVKWEKDFPEYTAACQRIITINSPHSNLQILEPGYVVDVTDDNEELELRLESLTI